MNVFISFQPSQPKHLHDKLHETEWPQPLPLLPLLHLCGGGGDDPAGLPHALHRQPGQQDGSQGLHPGGVQPVQPGLHGHLLHRPVILPTRCLHPRLPRCWVLLCVCHCYQGSTGMNTVKIRSYILKCLQFRYIKM